MPAYYNTADDKKWLKEHGPPKCKGLVKECLYAAERNIGDVGDRLVIRAWIYMRKLELAGICNKSKFNSLTNNKIQEMIKNKNLFAINTETLNNIRNFG